MTSYLNGVPVSGGSSASTDYLGSSESLGAGAATVPSKIVLQQTWVGERGSLQQQQGPLVRAESTSTVVSLGVPSREEVEFAQRDYLKVSSTKSTLSPLVFTYFTYQHF